MNEVTRREFLKSASIAGLAGGSAITLLPQQTAAQGSNGNQRSNRTASGVISLPKGGGALRGIGEKFTPDLDRKSVV